MSLSRTRSTSKKSATATRKQTKTKPKVKGDPTQISIVFTNKPYRFFMESQDRIFSSRTPFEKAMERFNVSFAKQLNIYSPKTNAEYELFMLSAPQRILAVQEGTCEVVISGSWGNPKTKEGRNAHAVMVHKNEKGHYLIFNANDDDKTAREDGFYDCYHFDNDLFYRPLEHRKYSLHKSFEEGACFVISYALKLLCERMPLAAFLSMVKKKDLEYIMREAYKTESSISPKSR